MVMLENALICGANWLGDSIMSMPAIQQFKAKYPECRLTMLVKPKLAELWSMHQCIDSVMEVKEGFPGTLGTAGALKKRGFDTAFIFSNSFRSALIPFLAGVPERRGYPGHQRSWMLTDVASPYLGADKTHQSWEYPAIMGLAESGQAPGAPELRIPESISLKARQLISPAKNKGWIGLVPGAAYGPAKRWPAEYFSETGRVLAKSGYGILVMGAQGELDLCAGVAGSIESDALNLAGRTSLPELAALFGLCRAVITNDSGGMHLAAATGANVVAVFGITDPSKTGPLGKKVRVVFDEGISRSRDIERISSEAEASLKSIKPRRVIDAVEALMQGD